MKIQQVRFQNLNSLTGEWAIDFTNSAYAEEGLFAITGPTGAGKTTILDAICLALYGKTPRLDRITKSENEVMSRQTGECYAEVTFATNTGRYRCRWGQRRARKKIDGELQQPERELANADTGKILESQLRGVEAKIEEITGMDFARFTRSMMLAQGAFAAFLKASADERAPILEQITGSEVYSEISQFVHERQREERGKLDALKAELSGITIRDDEWEAQVRQAIENEQKKEDSQARELKATEGAIQWRRAIAEMEKEIAALTDESARLQEESRNFAPLADQLKRAESAATLDSVHAALMTHREAQEDRVGRLSQFKQSLPELESALAAQVREAKAAERKVEEAKSAIEEAEPTWRRTRELDQSIAAYAEQAATLAEQCAGTETKISDQEAELARNRTAGEKASKELNLCARYLKENARDEALVSGLAGVREQVKTDSAKRDELAENEDELKAARRALAKAEAEKKGAEKALESQRKAMEAQEQALEEQQKGLSALLKRRTLRDYRAEKDALQRERVLHTKIAELEAERAHLEDGKPCPLCGATEHPYAQGSIPAVSEVDKKIDALEKQIRAAEKLEEQVKRSERAVAEQKEKFSQIKEAAALAGRDVTSGKKQIERLEKALAKTRIARDGQRATIVKSFDRFGVAYDDAKAEVALKSLEVRLKAWQQHTQKRTEVEKQVGAINGDIKKVAAVIASERTRLSKEQKDRAKVNAKLAATRKERSELFGAKQPDAEERKARSTLLACERASKEQRAQREQLQKRVDEQKTRKAALEAEIAKRAPELNALAASFSAKLKSLHLESEEEYMRQRLSLERRQALKKQADDLAKRRTQLQSRQADRQRRLTDQLARAVTEESLEALEPRAEELRRTLGAVRELMGGLRSQLQQNAEAKERIGAKQAGIDAQQQECLRWDNLHALIGSADGKKFRNFAQGLTFQVMIGFANKQLQRMTDRYLLTRSRENPLDLCVVDNYQAAEVRSTQNLSGGESFIVSLALALGLSQMASQKVRVDSLFLDEGFGTLDEEALEAALEALSTLQQSGKLIGVISHVASMKERIGTQIVVTPKSGGRSQISGPGCSAG
ncbi:MAG: AAA family ATPase [Kiritimatiellae bacterium]|nr:AAA family ATPase [Kiritimatiellia bacterium]